MNSILVVDDEADIRKSLRGALEDEGFKVGVAESGEACLETLKTRSYDLVLLDIWLPGIDGLETLEKIKEHEDPPEVIIISGHGTIETAVRATKLGAFDFLEKPLSLEPELFGYRNSAVSGEAAEKIGTFERADGGTLFLDEIADMSLKTQSKVLRTLEEQRFTPVGAADAITVDVRVIASTNKNLEEEIASGNFREDLFYRLNVIPFYVPPLRERIEDVPLLVKYFIREFSSR